MHPAWRAVGVVTCRECDEAPGTAVLIDALHDARSLAGEALRRKRIVNVLRDRRVDVIERIGQVRASRLASATRLQVRAVSRRHVELEADFDEPIVRQVRMAHTADLVTVAELSPAWIS